jgi:transcriptional regulator with GAF, ATPase, and Fis domain
MSDAKWSAIANCAAALQAPGQPIPTYTAIERATRALVGHRLFTLLVVDGDEVRRVHSSNPEAYPVSGRKKMGPTPWGDLVLRQQKPYLARNEQGIRWAFPDHALIASLGLEAAINVPVVHGGRTIGTMNLLDRADAYALEQVETVTPFAAFVVPAFLAEIMR